MDRLINEMISLEKYPDQYGSSKLSTAAAKDKLLARYTGLRIAYLYGAAADAPGTPLDTSCEAMTQGLTHRARTQHYFEFLSKDFPQASKTQYLQGVPGVAHNAEGIWKSDEGISALFGDQ